MSLPPTHTYVVPEQTARVAKAAFPQGTLCLQLYDHLGTILQDHDFTDLFPPRGQPAAAPFRLALVTVLQFAEGLSDRAAAEAVRGRLDWKSLLCRELEEAGFDHAVLCEFRERLLAGSTERRLLEKRWLMLSSMRQPRADQRISELSVQASLLPLCVLCFVLSQMGSTSSSTSGRMTKRLGTTNTSRPVLRLGPRSTSILLDINVLVVGRKAGS